MSKLIPTKVVDRNGKLTTVHKREQTAGEKESVLAAVKPAVATQPPLSITHTIKGETLPRGALSPLVHDSPTREELYDLMNCSGGFEWRKSVKMDDDVLYDYMRHGIDSQDAAVFQGMGYAPDDLPEHSAVNNHLPGNLGRVSSRKDGKETPKPVFNQKVIDRLQEAGFTALETEKVLRNNLQDEFLDQALNENQLVQVFRRWKHSGSNVTDERKRINDTVIDHFVTGKLPYETIDLSRSDLADIVYELDRYDDSSFKSFQRDPEAFTALVRKAAESMRGTSRISDLYEIMSEHGMETMEMNNPRLCDALVKDRSGSYAKAGLEAGKYFEEVELIAQQREDHSSSDYNRYRKGGGFTVGDAEVLNQDLYTLHKNGVPPEEAFESLAIHRLGVEQILISREDGITGAVSSGAL